MRNYEVTFIVDPVLSGDEIKAAANTYVDHLKGEGCEIVHIDEMGLRELAYPINKRNSGVYYCIEFQSETGELLPKLELALRRDERIMRFLTVKLDKYGVKYNADKRAGLIGTVKPKRQKSDDQDKKDRDRKGGKKKDAPKKEAPAKEEAPKKEAPAKEEAPKKETPAKEEAPKKEAPAKEEAPKKEAPAKEEAPKKEAPAKEEAPKKEAPAKEEAVKEEEE